MIVFIWDPGGNSMSI